ncbi:polynucleotide kinase-phosphatase [Aliterella atlantica]|uniref:Metallophosphoesterase n=1 Tax=Aliterella atlantica CENA595 TaxID=1618023 RepID=A0A0D8ZU61_9CYAN|nr:polynucleotide kinase-phosphatase [Aliterella atlantica]KJH72303.1 metallophosphoesterase [Aliterella atlantica CENA595]
MKITIPELSLVVLVGASGAGKSSFAKKHFQPTEVISSDFCRGLVSDDENNQAASRDAFDLLHYIAAKRLAAGKLTVIDATNVQAEDRKPLLALAKEYHCLPVAIALNLPEQVCHDRNQHRPDRNFGFHVVQRQSAAMRRNLRNLKREGFRYVYTLNSPEDIEAVSIQIQPLWNNRKSERGPFDIIGDIHGCYDELAALLQKLGYEITESYYSHPQGRKAVFLGDLVDRGNRILDTLNLVRNMVVAGTALCVPGNHDMKLMRKLQGKNVKITHGLDKTLAEIDALSEDTRQVYLQEITQFLDSLISHYVLDDGNLVVAHAGMKAALQGRGSGRVRDFALYGETTGETDAFGLPVRYDWAAEYRGKAIVVYGHTPVIEPQWLNGTIDIDTGCVYGGKLTALRYPEKEIVSVAAKQAYCESAKPFLPVEDTALTTQQQLDDVLDLDDVLGKRIIETRWHGKIGIREENAIAALEVMSRFAANPKWLIYLPPTMSPCETSKQPGLLEHPLQAFTYYQNQGVSQVICEEKHMGSRAIVIVCQSEQAALKHFGIESEGIGICYTRTGRRFFNSPELETQMLAKLQTALTTSGFWQEFNTSWVCLDCELMPWSAKAQELLQRQYAAVGAASQVSLNSAVAALKQAASRTIELESCLAHYQQRAEMADSYVAAYRRYCWQVDSIADFKLAPFHILATQQQVHTDKNHIWHMETIAKACNCDPALLLATNYQVVDVNDSSSTETAIAWWEELTSQGGEGIVVKPLDFVVKNDRFLVQPAVKCRGREYLRIIYGAEYTATENLDRLRSRGLSKKRSLALREFALGIEALERFTQSEPLRRVHECVFGILALESEPIDPRL